VTRVANGLSVVNRENKAHGIIARRGDGSFGELIPHETPLPEPGYAVKRGPIATIEIGIEVKIISKAMIRQIHRVINDLKGQVQHFKAKKGRPISIGVVGVNRAQHYDRSRDSRNGLRQDEANTSIPIRKPMKSYCV
jgi:hypothetical protein